MKPLSIEIESFILNNERILASWFGGSQATNRSDELSDIDLVIIAKNTPEIFTLLEDHLNSISTVELTHIETRRGNCDQRFYTLKNTPPTYYLDVCVFDSIIPNDYAEYFNYQRHGTPVIIKDNGILKEASQIKHFEEPVFDKKYNLGKCEILYRTFLKEAKREKFIDSYHFYFGLTQLWTKIVRLKYATQKHDFSLRYINVDLELNHALFLENSLKISSLKEMENKAQALYQKILEELQ